MLTLSSLSYVNNQFRRPFLRVNLLLSTSTCMVMEFANLSRDQCFVNCCKPPTFRNALMQTIEH